MFTTIFSAVVVTVVVASAASLVRDVVWIAKDIIRDRKNRK